MDRNDRNDEDNCLPIIVVIFNTHNNNDRSDESAQNNHSSPGERLTKTVKGMMRLLLSYSPNAGGRRLHPYCSGEESHHHHTMLLLPQQQRHPHSTARRRLQLIDYPSGENDRLLLWRQAASSMMIVDWETMGISWETTYQSSS